MKMKLLSLIDNCGDKNIYEQSRSDELNMYLCNISHDVKNHISKYCTSKCNDWDTMKKLTNPYELVFSNCKESFSKKRPISRAYFKLREIMVDFVLPWINPTTPLRTAHIAEAPGGFIECVLDIEKEHLLNINDMYGITYIAYDRRIPNWRISRDYMYKVHLNSEENYNGDIYNIDHIDRFVRDTGENTCFIVTADGGFDCSNDFNVQETSFAHMLLCEIYISFRTQHVNGVFIVKCFDIFTTKTLRLISILKKAYKFVHIVKPYTSRPANSEKYIVARGFLGVEGIRHDMELMRQCIVSSYNSTYDDIYGIDIMDEVRIKIDEFNVHFTMFQNLNILKTIICIEMKNKNADIFEKFNDSLYKNQVHLSKKFCANYAI